MLKLLIQLIFVPYVRVSLRCMLRGTIAVFPCIKLISYKASFIRTKLVCCPARMHLALIVACYVTLEPINHLREASHRRTVTCEGTGTRTIFGVRRHSLFISSTIVLGLEGVNYCMELWVQRTRMIRKGSFAQRLTGQDLID
jgi:hypothetical protein